MKKILVIFKKEFIDTIRDRRTIILMIVLPLLVFPLIMGVVSKLAVSQTKKAKTKVLKVGLITYGNADRFRIIINERKDMIIDESVKEENIESLIQDTKKDFIIIFEEDFDNKTAQKESGVVRVHFKSSEENDIAKRRIREVLNKFKAELLDVRLKALRLEKSFVEPLKIKEVDIVTIKEQIGRYVGGFLPYIFIIFCFVGAMYPAIDLAAGEKERSTIETLLTSPANRFQIVVGKFMVVTLAGLISAGVSIIGLFIAVKQAFRIPPQILDALLRIIEPGSIALLLSLLVPLCVFFAAVLLSFSIYAKSFKEAQSIMTPMNFIVIIPAIIGMLPGFKLNATTALLPIINVSLATKDIISGTIKTGLLLEVYLSLFILAGISLFFCTRWFEREDVIFRGI
jgi:sodium transport system permease protein